jgi:hypothetical protein
MLNQMKNLRSALEEMDYVCFVSDSIFVLTTHIADHHVKCNDDSASEVMF